MKYELTSDSLIIDSVKLYRIRALQKFGDIKIGDLGGYLEHEFNLSQFCNAWIYKNAKVSGNVRISGNTQVTGSTQISGNIKFAGNCYLMTHDWLLKDLDEFDILNIPKSVDRVILTNIILIKHLPHLITFPGIINLFIPRLEKLLPNIENLQCKKSASLKNKQKAMMEFQDLLIESEEFSEEEYKI